MRGILTERPHPHPFRALQRQAHPYAILFALALLALVVLALLLAPPAHA